MTFVIMWNSILDPFIHINWNFTYWFFLIIFFVFCDACFVLSNHLFCLSFCWAFGLGLWCHRDWKVDYPHHCYSSLSDLNYQHFRSTNSFHLHLSSLVIIYRIFHFVRCCGCKSLCRLVSGLSGWCYCHSLLLFLPLESRGNYYYYHLHSLVKLCFLPQTPSSFQPLPHHLHSSLKNAHLVD